MLKRQTLPKRGFTLIELLVVISIIMVLAGLTLSLFRYANTKAASDRARAEIAALSLSIESYKIDNGDYPRSDDTDKLNPRTNGNALLPTTGDTPYMLASLVLYKALSGDTNLDGTGGDVDTTTKIKNPIYFEFKPSLLYPKVPAGITRTALVKAIVDPFRNVYGYSTIGSKATPVDGEGYNPTFDLWSTADSTGTKTSGGDTLVPGSTTIKTEMTWIKNW